MSNKKKKEIKKDFLLIRWGENVNLTLRFFPLK
jgi:hypothetical protein